MGDPEDDDIDINPRPARALGERIVVLSAVCRRALLESSVVSADDTGDDAEADRFDLLAWLQNESCDGAISTVEKGMLSTPIGGLSASELTEATWRLEAVQALMWSAGLQQTLPDPWIEADAEAILSRLPAPFDPTAPLLASLDVRDDESLAGERERSELWLWRATVATELSTASGAARRDLLSTIAEVARSAGSSGLMPASEHDLLVATSEFAAIDGATRRPYRGRRRRTAPGAELGLRLRRRLGRRPARCLIRPTA